MAEAELQAVETLVERSNRLASETLDRTKSIETMGHELERLFSANAQLFQEAEAAIGAQISKFEQLRTIFSDIERALAERVSFLADLEAKSLALANERMRTYQDSAAELGERERRVTARLQAISASENRLLEIVNAKERMNDLNMREGRLKGREAEVETALAKLTSALERASATLGSALKMHDNLREAERAASTRKNLLEQKEEALQRLKVGVEAMVSRADESERGLRELEARKTELGEEVRKLKVDAAVQRDTVDREVAGKRAQLAELERQLAEKNHYLAERRREILKRELELDLREKAVEEKEAKAQSLEDLVSSLRDRIKQVTEENTALRKQILELTG